MTGTVKSYQDKCGVWHFDFIPYYSEDEIDGNPYTEERIVDRIEGGLIDNLLTIDKYNQYHIYKETAINCWSSALVYSSQGLDNAQTLDMWEQMQTEYEEQMERIEAEYLNRV